MTITVTLTATGRTFRLGENAAAAARAATLAEAARSEAQAAADLISGYIAEAVEEPIFAVRDATNRRLWLEANAVDGGPTEYAKARLRDAMPGLPEPEASDPDTLMEIRDATGRRTWLGARISDGGPTDYALTMLVDRLAPYFVTGVGGESTLFSGRGDSMMQSSYGGGDSLPVKLTALLGINVSNDAVSGSTPVEMAIKAGTALPLLTIAGGQLPADTGPVVVTWNLAAENFSGAGQPDRVYPGMVRGVPCNLTYDPDTGGLTLARAAVGASALPLASPVAFVPTPQNSGRMEIVFTGRNGTDKALNYGPIADHVARLRAKGIRFVLLSVTNMTSEPSGTAAYDAIVALNAQLIALAPYEYVDIRGRMIREGLALAGLSPTAADTTAISQDRIPPALLADGLHFNEAGRTAAALIIQNELSIRGMI